MSKNTQDVEQILQHDKRITRNWDKLTIPADKYGKFCADHSTFRNVEHRSTVIRDSGSFMYQSARINSPPLANNKPAAFNIVGQAQKSER